MGALIIIGTAVSCIGLVGLLFCIWIAYRARRDQLPEDEMKARLQRVVAINMAALFLSVIGLMLVVVGVIFS